MNDLDQAIRQSLSAEDAELLDRLGADRFTGRFSPRSNGSGGGTRRMDCRCRAVRRGVCDGLPLSWYIRPLSQH
jgi:hypothetical protein